MVSLFWLTQYYLLLMEFSRLEVSLSVIKSWFFEA